MISINGVNTGGKGSADNYTMYVFPHFTVHNSKYTKHFFVGSQRILSKLGQPGTLDDIAVIEKVNGKNHIEWGIKQGNTNDHIQGHIKWVGDDGTLMTAGKSGKIPPGILKKYSDLQDDTTNTGGNTDKYERNQYFFHPDHLGNTSFITDASGEVSQHVEYLPFGEIMVDDRPVNDKNPYLYNGKELDEETGLIYYGARYYNPEVGRWHGVDRMSEKHFSYSPFNYVLNNPIFLIDPDGRDVEPTDKFNKNRARVAALDLFVKSQIAFKFLSKFSSGNDYIKTGVAGDLSKHNIVFNSESGSHMYSGKTNLWYKNGSGEFELYDPEKSQLSGDVIFKIEVIVANSIAEGPKETGANATTINHEVFVHAESIASAIEKFQNGKMSLEVLQGELNELLDLKNDGIVHEQLYNGEIKNYEDVHVEMVNSVKTKEKNAISKEDKKIQNKILKGLEDGYEGTGAN